MWFFVFFWVFLGGFYIANPGWRRWGRWRRSWTCCRRAGTPRSARPSTMSTGSFSSLIPIQVGVASCCNVSDLKILGCPTDGFKAKSDIPFLHKECHMFMTRTLWRTFRLRKSSAFQAKASSSSQLSFSLFFIFWPHFGSLKCEIWAQQLKWMPIRIYNSKYCRDLPTVS